VQVIANDNHPGSPTGTARVFFDFMIHIVDGSLNRPPVASGNAGPFTAAIGVPFSNTITGTDPDGGVLTVSHLGLPTGATLSPASGTTGAQPLAATFSWTPTLADAGSSVGVTIVFKDPGGLEASRSFSISIPSNQPPIANAGPDQAVFDTDTHHVATQVSLDGTASSDPEGLQLTYSWSQIDGAPVGALANANTAQPSFTAPSLHNHPSGQPAPLQLTFRLTVSDGNTSRSDDVIVTVKHHNHAPTAAATGPALPPEGTMVTLDGSTSSDADLDPLSYTWTQTLGTPVTLMPNGTNNPTIVFTHGIVGPHSIGGELLEFTLTVSDGIASSTSTVVPVFIKNVNQAPTANAGDNDSVFDNAAAVTLHGSGSDPDGDPVSLQWTQVAGPSVDLQNAGTANPSFTPPAVSPAQGSVTLTFQLIANDAYSAADTEALDSAPSTVNVLVKHANRAPVADAGQSRNVPEETVVTLDGSGSYDPDQDAIASYTWTQIGGPVVPLDTTNAAHPSFTTPDVGFAGATLTFQLIVSDVPAAGSGGSLNSAPSTVIITVFYVNRAPAANAGVPQQANEGAIVTLNGAGSDPDGNAFTFAWTQTSGPAVTLSDPTAAQPTFTAPAVTRFGETVGFKLVVTDEFGLASSPASTSVGVMNVNRAPVADAGETLDVFESTAVNLAGGAMDHDIEEQALLTYAWQQTDGPSVTLAGGNTLSPSFTALS
jgi:hypothetical protein